MKTEIVNLLKDILKQLGIAGVEPEVSVPENSAHGDYSTNVAMKVFSELRTQNSELKLKTPMEVALQVAEKVKSQKSKVKSDGDYHNTEQKYQKISTKISAKSVLQDIERVEVAPPGFINFWLTEAKLVSQLGQVLNEKESYGKRKAEQGRVHPERAEASRRVMVEFAHPNTHKAFHIGHLRNITTGESIVRLLESQGIEVIRANYQGDVGMHIAKCLYSILRVQSWKEAKKLSIHERVEYLGEMYAAGNKAYEENPQAKKEIEEINRKIYAHDAEVYSLYEETRQWSLDYFDNIYKRVGSHFDRLYFEGEVYESGKQAVLDGVKKGIFEESEGAIIFPGEKFGLHNRVFVTRDGNATYEGKDMGLVQLQMAEYHPDLIVHVVSSEQMEYFKVIFEAMGQLFPETRGKQYHLIYGWVRLKEGKMSSRTGNVVLGEWLLDEAKKEIFKILDQSIKKYNKTEQEEIAEKAAVAAVKYSFLRVAIKQEIAFSLKESVSLEGDSGPYLQYTYARCRSVLRKAAEAPNTKHQASNKHQIPKLKSLEHSDLEFVWNLEFDTWNLNAEERQVARLIFYFPEMVAEAAKNLAPNTLCAYLFELAQAFNLFYQKHSILGSDMRQVTSDKQKKGSSMEQFDNVTMLRLSLTSAVAQVLANGLYLLGVATLEQM